MECAAQGLVIVAHKGKLVSVPCRFLGNTVCLEAKSVPSLEQGVGIAPDQ